jgi:hypothetical protein
MDNRGKTDQDRNETGISYEVDEDHDEKPPARAAAVANSEQERPAASLLGAERDLRAKQTARSQTAGGTAARPATSRLMQMEEDALNKARGSRSTTAPSVPGAMAEMPPTSLQALEGDLQTKNRAYSGKSTVVNPSVAAATAAARRAAQEHAATSKEEEYARKEDTKNESGQIPSAQVTRPPVASMEPPIQETASRSTNEPWADEESAVVSIASHNQSPAPALVTSTTPQTAQVAPLVSFPSQGSYDESADVVDVNPIEAFVAESNVVDAAGVAVVLDEEEEKQLEERKLRRWLIYGCIGLVILILVIVIPSVLLIGGGSKHEVTPTMTPSQVPSMAPSFAPTAVFFTTLESQLAPHSGSAVFQDRTSPQYAAVQWMTTFETEVRALSSDEVLQLYSMAVFYFALHGDSWKSCNRLQSGCSESTVGQGNSGWLTNTNVCSWYVISCQNDLVQAIQFGK